MTPVNVLLDLEWSIVLENWEDSGAEFEVGLARSPKTFENMIDIIIENSVFLPREASAEAQRAELNSESFRLLKAFLILARDHCQRNGLEPGTKAAWDIFEEANERAKDIIDCYVGLPFRAEERLALTPEEITTKLALTVPSYVGSDLIHHVKQHGKLGVPQDWLSSGVGNYVNGRFKSPDIDRLLLQVLSQVEIVAFIDEMTWKNPITGTSRLQDVAPPSALKAVWNVLIRIVGVWVISALIATLPLLIPALSQDLMLVTGLSVGGLGTLALLFFGVLGVIGVIKEKPLNRKYGKSIVDMIDQMNGFYIEFRSRGPFSLSHFKKRVNELADAGVIWPSGLFVLIEDMEERGVRNF